MSEVIQPGATLGMLGSGQLGRMFALAARRLGYRVHVYSLEEDSPTGQVADREWVGSYDDESLLEQFAASVDVVGYEFENVPARTAGIIERHTRLRPDKELLHVSQNRLREKQCLRTIGLPVPEFMKVTSVEEMQQAVQQIGCPLVLKTASSGYDGKGQRIVFKDSDAVDAWTALGSVECIAEQKVPFVCELSMVAARGSDGTVVEYGPITNDHANHILDVSSVPGDFPASVIEDAREMTRAFFEHLSIVGVSCIEFFLTENSTLLVNEIAPRPHNSGHLTIDAYVTCQFEQQVRAICGLPLGDGSLRQPAAMANLLGDLWSDSEPDWSSALRAADAHLHLYGKREPRSGRKMGHLTVLADSAEIAVRRAREIRDSFRTGR